MRDERRRMLRARGAALVSSALVGVYSAMAAVIESDTASDVQALNFHLQETIVDQYHPSFPAKYSGLNSLQNGSENKISVTTTIYLGGRLWNG